MKNSKIFDLAYLSVASYAELSGAVNQTDYDNKIRLARAAIEKYADYAPKSEDESKFSELVTNNYEVVAHWQDKGKFLDINNFIPFMDSNKNRSGFSASLFKNKANEHVLAFKGTAGGRDMIITDGSDIVLDGIAHEQIVDLYNFWIQMHTPKGEIYEAAYFRPLTAEDLRSVEKLEKQ